MASLNGHRVWANSVNCEGQRERGAAVMLQCRQQSQARLGDWTRPKYQVFRPLIVLSSLFSRKRREKPHSSFFFHYNTTHTEPTPEVAWAQNTQRLHLVLQGPISSPESYGHRVLIPLWPQPWPKQSTPPGPSKLPAPWCISHPMVSEAPDRDCLPPVPHRFSPFGWEYLEHSGLLSLLAPVPGTLGTSAGCSLRMMAGTAAADQTRVTEEGFWQS